ncbi:thyrotroph embryonic factor-like isoform X1 [Mytilus californianus]|uniref:thyrotroph embryonic factor-like isoform X1 n=1 Tax=Mytilus californianus TaxID=6549 RepID=UPI0022459020|nr:thyrotroph embryonic factor-like isoform X1 [Mytilus californianus]
MSLFGLGHTSYSLKELLENPVLQNPPQFNKDGGSLKPKEKGSMSPTFDPTSAFLGPNLWSSADYTDGDISLEYMDLDEFLSENGIPVDLNEASNGSSRSKDSQLSSPKESDSSPTSTVNIKEIQSPEEDDSDSDESIEEETIKKEDVVESALDINIEFNVAEQDVILSTVPGEETFDPKARKFSEDELKPQPMIKKSRKVFVPDEQKDDKYWCRRKKNNVAAKRSRDARRVKENQIAMRACYLEKCNNTLTAEVQKLKKENAQLKKSLEDAQQKLNSTS